MANGLQATRTRGDFPWLTRYVSGFTITPRLPDQLFDMVVNYCCPQTLTTLARCNKEVHAVAVPALYRTVVLTKKSLERLTRTKTHKHKHDKWFKYTVECCRLTTQARVVGDIWCATTLGLLWHCLAEDDKVRVLFPNVSTVCIEDAPIQSLHECMWLFRPLHLCLSSIHSPQALDLDEGLVYGDALGNQRYEQFRRSVQSLTIHTNDKVRIPCFAFQNLTLRIICHPSQTLFGRLELPTGDSEQAMVLSPPRSIHIVASIKQSEIQTILSNNQSTRTQNFQNRWISICDSIVGTVRDEDRDIIRRVSFTPTAEAAPCTVCGTL